MKKENDFKIEIFDNVVENNLEEKMSKTLMQTYSFLDQMIIDVSKNEVKNEEIVKNILNLKIFIENTLFEYKIKMTLKNIIESKKKEKDKEID